MKSRLFRSLGAAPLLACCLSLGCGPSTSTPDPDKVQDQADYQAEMKKQEAALMGERPAPPAKPAEKPEPAAEPAADAKPTE